MLVLALETSTSSCTVAVTKGEELLAELTLHVPRAHSTRLMPLLAQAVAEAGVDKRELDGIAVGVGPGSFTGLRIGLSTAKALGHALGKPVVGVDTLLAIAYGSGAQIGLVVPMLDAKRDEVFTGIYAVGDRRPSTWVPVMEPTLLHVDALAERLQELRQGLRHTWQPVLLCGDAAAGRAPRIGDTAVEAPAATRLPRGWAVAAVGREMLAQGLGGGPEAVAPVYLRRSAAEERFG